MADQESEADGFGSGFHPRCGVDRVAQKGEFLAPSGPDVEGEDVAAVEPNPDIEQGLIGGALLGDFSGDGEDLARGPFGPASMVGELDRCSKNGKKAIAGIAHHVPLFGLNRGHARVKQLVQRVGHDGGREGFADRCEVANIEEHDRRREVNPDPADGLGVGE